MMTELPTTGQLLPLRQWQCPFRQHDPPTVTILNLVSICAVKR